MLFFKKVKNGSRTLLRVHCIWIVFFAAVNAFGQSIPSDTTKTLESADNEYRQVVISENGGPEVLTFVRHTTLSTPGPGEVRIKVLAAGV